MNPNLIGLIALLVLNALVTVLFMPSMLRWIAHHLRSVLESHANALEAYCAVWRLSRQHFIRIAADHQEAEIDSSLLQEVHKDRRSAAVAAAARMKEVLQ